MQKPLSLQSNTTHEITQQISRKLLRMDILTRKRYVVKHNLITEVYLMTVMEATTCFGMYWPSSGCLGNLRASYMHVHCDGSNYMFRPVLAIIRLSRELKG